MATSSALRVLSRALAPCPFQVQLYARLRRKEFTAASHVANSSVQCYIIPSETAMEQLAAVWSSERCAGDTYLLKGNVGAGKSAFSRAFIRHACGDCELPVPSPTYLLLNTYDETITGPSISHFDLYRLSESSNFERLGLDEAMEESVCLIEWPERLKSPPESAINVEIQSIPKAVQQRVLGMLSQSQRARVERVAARAEPQEGEYVDTRWRVVVFSSSRGDFARRVVSVMHQQSSKPDCGEREWVLLDGPQIEEVLQLCGRVAEESHR